VGAILLGGSSFGLGECAVSNRGVRGGGAAAARRGFLDSCRPFPSPLAAMDHFPRLLAVVSMIEFFGGGFTSACGAI